MGNQLDISNAALIRIGAEPVIALSDGGKGAKACVARFSQAKKYLLRRHPWNFAIARIILNTPEEEAPDFGFSFSFVLPTNCLRVLEVEDEDYRIEGKTILCDSSSINLRYIKDVDEDDINDSNFRDALSAYLAWDICYYVTQSATLKQVLWAEFKDIFSKAKTPDAQEEPTKEIGAELFLESRLAGSSATPKRNWEAS